ncbi:type IV pilus biogenesis protein PilM [Guptibacillus hwajinpoensis]|uniref:type IV pilus biogenesis protein PilM n=1 Tax=Guptibacillus hwajinpoensis TaxID=208199 RepID=UPI00273C9448|nr:pilus assembly protein PilM [Alkalihalobacillus macyae]
MMSFFRFKQQSKQISMILHDHVIRMVELSHSTMEIRSYRERFLPEGIIRDGKIIERDTLFVILEECVEEWGIKGKRVVFQVPDTYLVLRNEKIPHTVADDDIKGYLYLEIGTSIMLPFKDPVFDYELIGQKTEHKEILLFAAPEEIVNDLSSLLESVSLHPEAADVTALSLYRLYYHTDQIDSQKPTLLIHCGIKAINVSVFYQHKPAFIRQVLLDTPQSNWDVVQTTRSSSAMKWIGDREELIEIVDDSVVEIERVINFYHYSMNKSDQTIQRVFLSGDFPELSLIKKRLESTVDIAVQHAEPNGIKDEKGDLLPLPYYGAYGLSLKGWRNVN